MRLRTGLLAALAAASLATGCATGQHATTTLRVEVRGGDAEAVSKTALVLLQRLKALGLSPGRAKADGAVVTVPVSRALTAEEAAGLQRPGVLLFRPVLQTLPSAATPGPDCAGGAGADRFAAAAAARDADPVVACDVDGTAKYRLGPAEMSNLDVKTATVGADGSTPGQAQWVVRLEMRDATRWRDLTARYTGKQLAIVLDGAVQNAPTINEAIPDGTAQITGSFTEDGARALAAVLEHGALPAPVTLVS
jgi:preprotein translocase subunit SecD